MIERPTSPHFLRFVRALAFVSGAAGTLTACASTAGASDASDAAPYDGQAMGIGPSVDAGISVMPDSGTDAPYVYEGGPVGVIAQTDAGHD